MSTVIVDARSRIPLPQVRPGDKFDLQIDSEGRIVLSPLVPSPKAKPQKAPVLKPRMGKDGLPIVAAKIPKGLIAKLVREDRDSR